MEIVLRLIGILSLFFAAYYASHGQYDRAAVIVCLAIYCRQCEDDWRKP